jgi:hypothetical protein
MEAAMDGGGATVDGGGATATGSGVDAVDAGAVAALSVGAAAAISCLGISCFEAGAGGGLASGAVDATRCSRFGGSFCVGAAKKKPLENPMVSAATTEPTPAKYDVVLNAMSALLQIVRRKNLRK